MFFPERQFFLGELHYTLMAHMAGGGICQCDTVCDGINPEKGITGNGIGSFLSIFLNGDLSGIVAVFNIVPAHIATDTSCHGRLIPGGFVGVDIAFLILYSDAAFIAASIDISTVIAGTDTAGFPGSIDGAIVCATFDYRDNGIFFAFAF